jgi:hypothetical protein
MEEHSSLILESSRDYGSPSKEIHLPSNRSTEYGEKDDEIHVNELNTDYRNESAPKISQESIMNREAGPSWTYYFFRSINFMSVGSLVFLLIAQALPPPHQTNIIISKLKQIYILIACFVGLLAEFEVSEIYTIAPFLYSWPSRGFFYLFMAIISSEESTLSNGDTQGGSVTSVLLNIVSITLVLSGCLYILLGVFCLRRLKIKCEQEYEELQKTALDAKRRLAEP